MRILYLSAHEILEYDEIKLFYELGYKVFSPGAYVCNKNKGDRGLRPTVHGLLYDPDIVEKWHKLAAQYPGDDPKNHLTKEFVDNFDIVIVMHLTRWITGNWDAIKHKRVIWRTIGQSISSTENQLTPYRQRGMEIVRYSPRETRIPGFIGQDTIIRFYKDPEEYKDWNGEKERVITFAQSMKDRDRACNFSLFEATTRPLSRHLFGPGNENIGEWTSGEVPYTQLKQELRDNRAYFYTGTKPASYTLNFIESWMTGIPLVCIGPQQGNASYFPGHDLYEIGDLIVNGVNGFISNNPLELRECIQYLFKDKGLASKISAEGRKSAINHFGKNEIAEQWRRYLNA